MSNMFKRGDRVISEYYGEGTVTDTIGEYGETYPIRIQFDELDIENDDMDGIQYFSKEGYYDCDRKESDMIKLIQTESKQEDNNMNKTEKQLRDRATQMLHRLSDSDRKFKIKYRDLDAYINRYHLRDITIKTIIGRIENFTTDAEVVISGDNGEFCIIQYKQILQMEEIVSK